MTKRQKDKNAKSKSTSHELRWTKGEGGGDSSSQLLIYSECDISSRDFSVSRLFSIFWEYRSRSRKFWSQKKVSVSVSKIFGLEKKSRYRSRKHLVSKKVSVSVSKNLLSKKVSVSVSMKFFGLVTQWWQQIACVTHIYWMQLFCC